MKLHWKSAAVTAVIFILFLSTIFAGNNKEKEVKSFTAFFDVPVQNVRDEDNDLKEIIAEKIGAKCQEIWLDGQTSDEAIASYIAGGEYPDFIAGDVTLYEAGALVPIDLYWDDYPNIRSYLSETDWERLRQSDGHIYWLPQFGVVKGEYHETIHEGEAFWIQTRVLKWAGYPEIDTVEEYFALLEDYMEANPVMETGQTNIPFTILCDDWRYFCLENVPQFLDGYPNDGSCMVDPSTQTVLDYNVTETARKYFQILNKEYHNGIVDPEAFTQTYSEYLDKLATGRVLGMVDQWWQFAYDVNDSLSLMGDMGCGYVPLPITIEEGVRNQWHVKRGRELTTASGVSITVSCQDIEGAMQFMNDLLGDEIELLRYWGIEGVDYEVKENGEYYRTEKQRAQYNDSKYQSSHFCSYAYFPRTEGVREDGINAFSPEYQPAEFLASLPQDVKECLEAYGCQTYVDLLGTNDEPGSWYPMYSYTDMLTEETPSGRVWKEMAEIKHAYLPQVVMSDDFETMWELYMQAYKDCEPEILIEDLQQEVGRRILAAEKIQ